MLQWKMLDTQNFLKVLASNGEQIVVYLNSTPCLCHKRTWIECIMFGSGSFLFGGKVCQVLQVQFGIIRMPCASHVQYPYPLRQYSLFAKSDLSWHCFGLVENSGSFLPCLCVRYPSFVILCRSMPVHYCQSLRLKTQTESKRGRRPRCFYSHYFYYSMFVRLIGGEINNAPFVWKRPCCKNCSRIRHNITIWCCNSFCSVL